MAAGNVPACRNLRKDVTQCLPPEREAVGTNRECDNGIIGGLFHSLFTAYQYANMLQIVTVHVKTKSGQIR